MSRLLFTALLLVPLWSTAADYFLVSYHPGSDYNLRLGYAEQPGLSRHHAYVRRLHSRDQLLMAGIVEADTNDDSPVALALLKTASEEEARALVADDPGVRSRIITATVTRWTVELSSLRFQSRKNLTPTVDNPDEYRLERIDSESAINTDR